VSDLVNLVVELDDRFDATRAPLVAGAGVRVDSCAEADERVLSWIDEQFGGSWSSEAHAGSSALAIRGDAPIGFATFDPKGLRFAWLRGLARERDVGVFGPFGIAAGDRGAGPGQALLWHGLAGLRQRGYARALIGAVGDERLIRYYGDAVGARITERFDRASLMGPRPRVVVMASGRGTNLQAVLDGARDGRLPIDVVATIANDPRAYAIERARKAGVPAVEILPWHKHDEPRARYDERLLHTVAKAAPDIVLLLGWMHLLAEPFVRAFPNLLNLHPAFLPLDPQRDDVGLPDGTRIPAYRGRHAVRDALLAGSTWIGATVHLVTPAADRGPILTRKPVRVGHAESESSVMERLHPIEHDLVSSAILRWLYERDELKA
jgi:phosphoribosylglycinamide formyltransferase 1